MSENLTTFRFGDWTVEPVLNRISHDDQARHLEPLAMDVLVQLLSRPGEVVTADDLLAACWAGRHGEPGMVARCVNQIRRALGDDARQPLYVETVRKRGYRTLAPVSILPAATSVVSEAQADVRSNRDYWLRSMLIVMTLMMIATGGWFLNWWAPEHSAGKDQRRTEYVRAYSATPKKLALRPLDNQPATVVARTEILDAIQDMQGVSGLLYQHGGDHDFELWLGSRTAADQTSISLRFLTADRIVRWSETYRENDPMVFSQAYLATSELKAAIDSVYVLPLLPDSISQPARSRYVEGMQQWLGPRGNTDVAIAAFEEAVTLSPEFWVAWGQLTALYVDQQSHESIPKRRERAYRAARELLKLKPVSAYNFVIGMINLALELDYQAARVNLLAAKESPGGNNQSVYFQLGNVAAAEGELDQAIRHYETAAALGPGIDQMPARLLTARMHLANGDHAVAARLLRHFLDSYVAKPRIARGLQRELVLSLTLLGQKESALKQLNRYWAVDGHSHPEWYPHLFAALGLDEQARSILAEMDAKYEAGTLPRACNAVDANVFLNDFDEAIRWMDIAIENHEWWWFPILKKASYLEPLRADPRFPAVMEKLTELEARGTRLPLPNALVKFPATD